MKQFEYTVKDPIGIHARPAGLLLRIAKDLISEITIEKVGGKTASVKKLMAVLSLGVKHGDTIVITVEGEDEDESIRLMEEFCRDNL